MLRHRRQSQTGSRGSERGAAAGGAAGGAAGSARLRLHGEGEAEGAEQRVRPRRLEDVAKRAQRARERLGAARRLGRPAAAAPPS